MKPIKNPIGQLYTPLSAGPEVIKASITPEEFLTTKELMKLLKIKHRQTIYELIETGMPAIRVGKSYRFIRDEVVGFLRQQARKAKHNPDSEVKS